MYMPVVIREHSQWTLLPGLVSGVQLRVIHECCLNRQLRGTGVARGCGQSWCQSPFDSIDEIIALTCKPYTATYHTRVVVDGYDGFFRSPTETKLRPIGKSQPCQVVIRNGAKVFTQDVVGVNAGAHENPVRRTIGNYKVDSNLLTAIKVGPLHINQIRSACTQTAGPKDSG